MVALASLIPELEDALQGGSAAKHAVTLRRVTDLFLENASRFSGEHVELFDDVLSRLIIEVETKVLAELARRIAPVDNAPPNVVRRLAHDDDITVAGPVLLRSSRLDETDLVEIARSSSQAHLLAISARSQVGTAVTDVLVGRGDQDVARNVANNPGAQFSEAAFAVLVQRALQDGALAQTVGLRTDIPPHLFRKLLIEATEIVQRRLLAAARPETRDEIKRILARVSADIGDKVAPPRDYRQAQQTVLAMHRAGKLGEVDLLAFAKSGRYEETVAALAALCAVPIEVVDRLLDSERPDPVLILCRAIGFDWPTARAVFEVRAGRQRVPTQTLDGALANFARLSAETAQRVLRFWQVQQDHPPKPV